MYNFLFIFWLIVEFEPFDVEKEKYIQHDLMERLDRHFVSTTRLRKSASKQVRRKVKSLIRPELKYVVMNFYCRCSCTLYGSEIKTLAYC
jgi:hypothetical protein